MSDLAVLAENAEREARIVAEACEHRMTTVVDRFGDNLDDHVTDYVKCMACRKGLVVTFFYTRPEPEIRPMTPAEERRYL